MLDIEACTISRCTVASGSYRAEGGALSVYTGMAYFTSCSISGCAAKSETSFAYGGGMYLGSGVGVLRSCTVADCWVMSVSSYASGGILFVGFGDVTLLATSLLNGSATSPSGIADGRLVSIESGAVSYLLPSPLAHWVPAALCRIIYNACPTGIPGCNRTIQGVAPLQQCSWQSKPDLLGQYVHTLPSGPIEYAAYPFPDVGVVKRHVPTSRRVMRRPRPSRAHPLLSRANRAIAPAAPAARTAPTFGRAVRTARRAPAP
eukprot:4335083-Prymnesium_polylepis.1